MGSAGFEPSSDDRQEFRRRAARSRLRFDNRRAYIEEQMVTHAEHKLFRQSLMTWGCQGSTEVQEWWPNAVDEEDTARTIWGTIADVPAYCAANEPNMLVVGRSHRPSLYYPMNNRRDPANPRQRRSGWLRVDNDPEYLTNLQPRIMHLFGKDLDGRWLDGACEFYDDVARVGPDLFRLTTARDSGVVVQLCQIDDRGRILRFGGTRIAKTDLPPGSGTDWGSMRFECRVSEWANASQQLPSSACYVANLPDKLRPLDMEYRLLWEPEPPAAVGTEASELGDYSRNREVLQVIDRHLVMDTPQASAKALGAPAASLSQPAWRSWGAIVVAGYLMVGFGLVRMLVRRKCAGVGLDAQSCLPV